MVTDDIKDKVKTLDDVKDKVNDLYEIMKDEKIQELEVNSKKCKIRIKRKDSSGYDLETIQRKHTAVEKKEIPLIETIKSPIMGVVYLAPSPSSTVFVNIGGIVEMGEVLCIVEAMKTMNEIKAAFKAKVLKILVKNGASVNVGQDLFCVEKI